ncbi:MAG: hypothetical protein JW910_14570 [Anaerolineae bacterium]|nr:hypothetical protein [Anaerolineae bacterium]
MRRRLALFALLTTALMLAAGCMGGTSVVFDNQTVCGTIQVELTNTETGITETYDVPMGETLAIDVTPNITYRYVVDYTVAGENADGFVCTAVHRGQVTVPTGTSQTFNLTAVTPTPEITPGQ